MATASSLGNFLRMEISRVAVAVAVRDVAATAGA